MTDDLADDNSLIKILVECIVNAIVSETITPHGQDGTETKKKSRFEAKLFFQRWFRQHGSPWFFLFKKNQRVTNIQYAELFALIRSNADRSGRRIKDVQFVSVSEFNTYAEQVVGSFSVDESALSEAPVKLANLFLGLLKDLVAVDPYFGSCSVFLPPQMTINHTVICGTSGYIHSCGRSVFVRNISKATKEELSNNLYELTQRYSHLKRIRLIVYGHEDFTSEDRHQAEYLKDGLDDVKFYIEKYYMGPDPLVRVLKEIGASDRFGNKLTIPPPRRLVLRGQGDGFKPESNSAPIAADEGVVWLIVDHGLGSHPGQRGPGKYFIAYLQEMKNDNVFQLFDENKPAWIDHTTIPHTLMGAMLNITRPWWPASGCVIGDPFVGTGTTWFEALKYSDVTLDCSDKSELVTMLAEDNARFFCLGSAELKDLIRLIREAEEMDPAAVLSQPSRLMFDSFQDSGTKVKYRWAIKRYLALCPEEDKHGLTLSEETVLALATQEDLLSKLLLYIILRTHRRNLVAFSRGEVWRDAFRREAEGLCLQIQELVAVKDFQVTGATRKGNLLVSRGRYSETCGIFLPASGADLVARIKRDVSKRSVARCPADKFDLIVADPPYGMNDPIPTEDLAALYKEALERMFESLKPGGQLVIALPDSSYVGKYIPYFVRANIVAQQFIAIAERAGAELFSPQYSGVHQPYYWESQRALRRAILHFRVIKVQNTEGME
ncbi:MAG TPA: hypothetical protein VHW09_24095 [Bryobacteraceae bacterium]|jgi:hypothetical protein|nr:hypothetical protein [Bryobacteraceae bacterium]